MSSVEGEVKVKVKVVECTTSAQRSGRVQRINAVVEGSGKEQWHGCYYMHTSRGSVVSCIRDLT